LRGTQEVRGSIPLSSTERGPVGRSARVPPGAMSSWDDHDGDDLLLPREHEAVAGLSRNTARLLGLDAREDVHSVLAAALRSAIVTSVQLRATWAPATEPPGPAADPRSTRWIAEQLQRQRATPAEDPHTQQAATIIGPLLSPPRPQALLHAVARALRQAQAQAYGECQRMVEDVAATLRHLGYMDSAMTVDDLAAAFEAHAERLREPE
jgi:hypothetical protein